MTARKRGEGEGCHEEIHHLRRYLPAEGLDGFAAAHADIVALGAERKFVRRRTPNLNKSP